MEQGFKVPRRVAVVGAGLAGLSCAAALVDAGCQVSVFEKSRGTGGRLASTRLSSAQGEWSADLGAPWIETADAAFLAWLQSAGARVWQPVSADFALQSQAGTRSGWVGVPRNSALTRHLSSGVELHTSIRVSVVWPDQQGVLLRDEQGQSLGYFDAAVVAAPAPQAALLLEALPRLAQRAETCAQQPTWVLALALSQRPQALAGIDYIEGEHPVLRRVLRDSSKPAREGEVWLLEASDTWSREYVNLKGETVAEELRSAFETLAGEPITVLAQRAHRWLYARAHTPDAQTGSAWWDAQRAIGVCGDWLGDGQRSPLERAWYSGRALAERMLGQIT